MGLGGMMKSCCSQITPRARQSSQLRAAHFGVELEMALAVLAALC